MGDDGRGNGKREWTREEKFEKLAEAGFTGIMGRLPEEREAEVWRRLLDQYGFSIGIHARVSNGVWVQVDVGHNGEHPMVAHLWDGGSEA